jgi:hypothetical protein
MSVGWRGLQATLTLEIECLDDENAIRHFRFRLKTCFTRVKPLSLADATTAS